MGKFRDAGRLTALLLSATSAAALAQTAPQAAAEGASSGGLQEIVVTARRRSESISNVPTAIQAVSSEALVARGIKNESDLQTAVSGLVVRASNNQNQLNYVIRGESVEPYSGSSPGVQPYFNEVALSGNAATAFYDVESVQVLKGPQGTLFGRNSTGGAVLYQSATPSNEVAGWGSVQYGNRKKLVVEGALNVPLVDEKVLVRVAGTYQSGGAFVRNIYDGSLNGDTKTRSGRITLKLAPTETITNTLMAQLSKATGTNAGNRMISSIACGDPANPNPNLPSCYATPGDPNFERLVRGPTGSIFPGYPDGFIPPVGFRDLPAYLDAQGKYVVANNGDLGYYSLDRLLTNATEFEIGDDMSIKNIFGYGKTKRRFSYDNDANFMPYLQAGGGLPGGNQQETRHTRIISDELQLQGKAIDNRLTYILGLFYSDALTYNNSPITGLFKAGNVIGVFRARYKSNSKDKAKAVFGQATYAVTDKLNVTGGLRQAWNKLSLRQLPGSTITGPAYFHTKNDDISYTVSIDYHFTPALMGYVSSRGSWRVGGYNPFIAGTTNTAEADTGGNYFPPEKVRDVEVGFKFAGRVGDMPTRINADIFNAWIDNNQKTAYGLRGVTPTSTTITAPHAKVRGFEIDGDIAPVEGLRFGGNFSYTDAKYGRTPGIAFGSAVRFGPYSDVPKYQGTVYGEVTVPLEENGSELRFHGDLYGQTAMHISNLGNSQNPYDLIDGYVLVNARIDWVNPMGFDGLTASVFGKNLTAKAYYIGGSGGIGLDGKNSATFGAPRTYGAVLRYSF
jgi:iron complex outermembrane recepter protein